MVDWGDLGQAGPALTGVSGSSGDVADAVLQATEAAYAAITHPGVGAGVDRAQQTGHTAGRKLTGGFLTSGGFCTGSAGSFQGADRTLAATAGGH